MQLYSGVFGVDEQAQVALLTYASGSHQLFAAYAPQTEFGMPPPGVQVGAGEGAAGVGVGVGAGVGGVGVGDGVGPASVITTTTFLLDSAGP